MKMFLAKVVFFVVRIILSLRYRVKVTGDTGLQGKGILFLPNHPAEIDPLLVMVALEKFHPRPLVVEQFYYLKGFHFFMELVGALPMPDFVGSVNSWKMRQVEKRLKQIADKLGQGDNFLIYPSGRLKGTEEEQLGGASFIPNLLQLRPESRVILVRTTGLWGSLFSKAITGSSPDFGKTLWSAFKILMKNGIFFAPRRTVHIHLEEVTLPLEKTKLEINRYLEKWYNQIPDPLTFVPFYFWKYEIPKVQTKKQNIKNVEVPSEIRTVILSEIAKLTDRKKEQLTDTLRLSQDLGLDSLDMATLALVLHDRYHVSEFNPGEIQTIRDLMVLAVEGKKEPEESEKEAVKRTWKPEKERLSCALPQGNTLQEAFLLTCDRMGKSQACADSFSGVLSYARLKVVALILSRKIALMPGKNIGIMLPSTVGAYTVILATLLAKKVPVMFNWTAGKRALDHSLELTSVKCILSSYRFLSRLQNGDMGNIEEKIILLEEMRKEISLKDKLKGALLGFFKGPALIKKLQLSDLSSDATAVILFTSGTETLPKGVPLTHANLLSNQRAALSSIHVKENDIFFGCLPPFHSFGFSATGLLPLLSGIKTCYYPDPTDSRGMVTEIARWKPTILCAAPGFINGILSAAEPEHLESLRLIVSGAEKAPKTLFDQLEVLGKQCIEGYGITECAPVVTLQRLNEPRKGVGHPLPGVHLMVINPATDEILQAGEEGEVCISGPSVFKGYLAPETIKNPFIHLYHQIWYRSGDRGIIDSDGTLILLGRLKRFIKIGGEMVGLGGLEDDLLQIIKEKKWPIPSVEGPPLALIASSEEGGEKVKIILFTVINIRIEEVNGALRERGTSQLAKISEVQKIEQIPLTGTGKTHYRLLEELWKNKQSV